MRRWTQPYGRETLRGYCQNDKCNDAIYGEAGSRIPRLCPACRFIGRRAFARGATAVAGIVALAKLVLFFFGVEL